MKKLYNTVIAIFSSTFFLFGWLEPVREVWVGRYHRSNIDEAQALTIDEEGNVSVTGSSSGVSSTTKYHADGLQPWLAVYEGPAVGGDMGSNAAVDSEGNVIVTGQSAYEHDCDYEMLTVQYDLFGDELWDERYNGPGEDYAYGDQGRAIAVDGECSVFVTGIRNEVESCHDMVTIKYDTQGNEMWMAKQDGSGNGHDGAQDLALGEQGNVYVTGRSEGNYND